MGGQWGCHEITIRLAQTKALKPMAYGNAARVEKLRHEIAEISEQNLIHTHRTKRSVERKEYERRNSRLREIQAELQAMMKKGSGIQQG